MQVNSHKSAYLPYPSFNIATDKDIFNTRFFWDVKINKLNKEKNADFIIERVLEHGDLEHMNWLFANYGKEKIIKVIKTSKRISPKVANFWKIYLKIKGKIQCLEPQYLKMREKIWPY